MYQPIQAQNPNLSAAQKLLKPAYLLGIALLVVLIFVFLIFRGSQFRFAGLKANGKNLSTNSAITLKFSQEIGNTDQIKSQLKLSPTLDMDILVTSKEVTVVPVKNLLLNTPYKVSIPEIISKKGKHLNNLQVTFVAKNTSPDQKNAVDLEDIIYNRYPQLSKLEKTSDTHVITHELLENNLVLVIRLQPVRDISKTDKEMDEVLKSLNKEVLSTIKGSGLPMQEINIRYDNNYQNRLLYDESIAFLKN